MTTNNATTLSFSFKCDMTNSHIDDNIDCYFNVAVSNDYVPSIKNEISKIMQQLTNLHSYNNK